MVYAARATRGHRFCGVLTTPGGRVFLLLGYSLFESHEMVLDVVRPEMTMDFGSKEVEPMLDEGGCLWIAHGLMWDC